jgi:hypothetical protein
VTIDRSIAARNNPGGTALEQVKLAVEEAKRSLAFDGKEK